MEVLKGCKDLKRPEEIDHVFFQKEYEKLVKIKSRILIYMLFYAIKAYLKSILFFNNFKSISNHGKTQTYPFAFNKSSPLFTLFIHYS